MDENFKKQMEANGVDVDATLKRFMGKEAIFMKFIMKFADDQNCRQIRDGLENRDVQAAFDRAHSLKGVAGKNWIWISLWICRVNWKKHVIRFTMLLKNINSRQRACLRYIIYFTR